MKLLRSLKLKKPGLDFYTFRHVFETVAGDALDQAATDVVMGHVDDSMADRYREGVKDDRLRCVTNHVRAWLFSNAKLPTGRRIATAERLAGHTASHPFAVCCRSDGPL